MYNASADFKTKIKSKERTFEYQGNIVTAGGITYPYYGNDIRSGKIVRSISGNSLEIGTVYASEYDVELGLSINRYELYGAEIDLSIKLVGASDDIPMGKYSISEITQTQDRLHIKAYDSMVKFEKDFDATTHTEIKLPYEWLTEACAACGVALGSTAQQIMGLPNGRRKTGLADVVADVKTWRDVLAYLGTYLGSYSYIGRDGKLYVTTYKGTYTDTVYASFRYSSNLSDYRTTYDGIYATYKEGGVQEYVANSNSNGLILDIGTNPFLQITDQQNRLDAIEEIINAWNGIYYVPYEAELPLIPIYDPGDVLKFAGNQADTYDIGAITEITYNIGGKMHVKCTGDNPRLASAQDRITKSVAGLSADYNNGAQSGSKNFWLLETTNTSEITVENTKTQIAVIEWSQSVDIQRMGFMFCCEANLSATAVISILITVDDSDDYKFDIGEEKALKGKRPFSRNCGFRVSGKGTHSAKVYMTVTNSPTLVGDLF